MPDNDQGSRVVQLQHIAQRAPLGLVQMLGGLAWKELERQTEAAGVCLNEGIAVDLCDAFLHTFTNFGGFISSNPPPERMTMTPLVKSAPRSFRLWRTS